MRFVHNFLISLQIVWLVVLCYVFASLYYSNFNTPWQHFSSLTDSFLAGRLDITDTITHDLVLVNGKYYWPNGPFPSVYLMPLQTLGVGFNQWHGQLTAIVVIFLLLYFLARNRAYSRLDSVFLSCVFLFGSIAVPLLIHPKSWFFSQVIAILLLLASLLEWETKRRPLLLGILLGCIFATRPTAGIIGLAFVGLWLRTHEIWTQKLQKIAVFCIPIILSGLLLLAYNYARFGAILDNGYTTNNVGPVSEPLRQIGVFSIEHIPMNFYWYFVASLTPITDGTAHLIYPYYSYSVWGLSLLVIAPFFLYSFRTFTSRNIQIRSYWFVILGTLALLLMYFNTGWVSYGPRYAADFFPILYALLLYSFPRHSLSHTHRFLILISCSINLYLLFTTPII
jgi:hypothetical protein